MLGIQQFKKMQELKKLGLSKLKVSEQLNLSYKQYITGGIEIRNTSILFKKT